MTPWHDVSILGAVRPSTEAWSNCQVQADFADEVGTELPIVLSPYPRCWNYRLVTPHLVVFSFYSSFHFDKVQWIFLSSYFYSRFKKWLPELRAWKFTPMFCLKNVLYMYYIWQGPILFFGTWASVCLSTIFENYSLLIEQYLCSWWRLIDNKF